MIITIEIIELASIIDTGLDISTILSIHTPLLWCFFLFLLQLHICLLVEFCFHLVSKDTANKTLYCLGNDM